MAPQPPDKKIDKLEMMTRLFEAQIKYNEAVRDTFKGISDSLKESIDRLGRKT